MISCGCLFIFCFLFSYSATLREHESICTGMFPARQEEKTFLKKGHDENRDPV
jgi:hypothetical protein